jgi:hypothetical protein
VLEPEHLVHDPRVVVEDQAQRVLAGGLHGEQGDVLIVGAVDRSAQDDDLAVDELVGEGGVLLEVRLLANAAGMVPVRPLGRRDREHRHVSGSLRK